MSGLEIVGVIFGGIAAIKALPEIPKAWKRLFGREESQTVSLNSIAVAHRETQLRVNSRRDRTYDSTMTMLRQYDDNRTAMHLADNHMHLSFDNNRYLSQTQNNEMLRDVLFSWHTERVVYFNQFYANQRLVIFLLGVVAILMYLLGQYSAAYEYLQDFNFRLMSTRITSGGTCPNIDLPNDLFLQEYEMTAALPIMRPFHTIFGIAKLPLLLLGSAWALVLFAFTCLGHSIGAVINFTWKLTSSIVTGLGRGFLAVGGFIWRINSSDAIVLFHGVYASCSYIWVTIASNVAWLAVNVQTLFTLAASLPFLWLGRMLLLSVGIGLGATSLILAVIITWGTLREGITRGRIPLIILAMAMGAGASGGLTAHYLEFSSVTCKVVALVPFLMWNVLAIAHGVTLSLE